MSDRQAGDPGARGTGSGNPRSLRRERAVGHLDPGAALRGERAVAGCGLGDDGMCLADGLAVLTVASGYVLAAHHAPRIAGERRSGPSSLSRPAPVRTARWTGSADGVPR